MTKRELSSAITFNFENLLETLFNAFDFDESEGGRRTFHIESDKAERGYFAFEWSRTGQDVCSWDSIKWVNPTPEQTATRNLVLKLEEDTQALFDKVIKEQTEIYDNIKAAK